MTGVSLTVAVGAAVALTTGASPVTADTTTQIYAITTGGTGGTEVIDIPMPELPLDGYANGQLVGRRVTLFLETLTDPSDVVQITVGGDPDHIAILSIRNPGNLVIEGGVILNFVGATASFVWCCDEWYLDQTVTDGNDGSTIGAGSWGVLQPTNTSDSQSTLQLHAGASDHATTPGSDIIFTAGNANSGTGNGGNITLTPGTSAGGTGGLIYLNNLPTADPHSGGALWNSAGTLKISAG